MSTTDAEGRREEMLVLWGITLTAFKARLEADKDGELSASFFDTVITFLRDSDISAETVDEARTAVQDLATQKLLRDLEEATADIEPTPEPTPPAKPARSWDRKA